MGFNLFQGYFFSKPVTLKTNENLSFMQINCLKLIQLANDPNTNYAKIANIIKHDAALSYQLLKVVNSAFFGFKYSIKNIRHALSILGMNKIKKCITLISLAQAKTDKPDELIQMALIRARFLELAAPLINAEKDAENLFMIGLISLTDAIMDAPLNQIIETIHISDQISKPVLTHNGPLGQLLEMIIAYENSNWDKVVEIEQALGLNDDELSKIYLEALDWANNYR